MIYLQGSEVIVLCDFPFVLDARAKSVLMHFECVLKMKVREDMLLYREVASLSVRSETGSKEVGAIDRQAVPVLSI